MALRSWIALVVAITGGVAAFVILRSSNFTSQPLPPGHGDEGELVAFECIAQSAPPNIEVHFDSVKEKFAARCSCTALADVMHALRDCCNNQPASAEAACDDRASFDVNCRGSDAGGLFLSGPGTPTLRLSFFGGFMRSNWSCVDEGGPNPDLEAMQKAFRSCCVK